MKPPKVVQVLQTPFTVSDPATPEEANLIGNDFGKTTFALQRILVGPGQMPETLRDTVLHEVLHACLFQTAFASDAEWREKYEEILVRSLTPILLDVLRRNPKFVEYLLER